MIIPDINLLLYAYNPHSLQNPVARDWWEKTINHDELIGLPLEVAFSFIRIATNQRLGPARVPLEEARKIVESWFELPQLRTLTPKGNHFNMVMELMRKSMSSGALLSDAILAAYAIENRATLFTNDDDFSRFHGLKWRNPILEGSQ